MKDTTDMEYEYILSFCCDHLCKYPDTCSDQVELDRALIDVHLSSIWRT